MITPVCPSIAKCAHIRGAIEMHIRICLLSNRRPPEKRRAPQSPGAGAGRPTRPPFSAARRGPPPQKSSEAPKLRNTETPKLRGRCVPRLFFEPPCRLSLISCGRELELGSSHGSKLFRPSRSLYRTYFVAFCRRGGIA